MYLSSVSVCVSTPTLQESSTNSFKLHWPAGRQTNSSSDRCLFPLQPAARRASAFVTTGLARMQTAGVPQINLPYVHRQQPPPDQRSQWTLQPSTWELITFGRRGLAASVERKVKQTVTKIKGVHIHGSLVTIRSSLCRTVFCLSELLHPHVPGSALHTYLQLAPFTPFHPLLFSVWCFISKHFLS